MLLRGCLTREKIDATIWGNNFPIPKEICDANPILYEYGHLRKLNDDKWEIMSICKDGAHKFVSMPEADYNRLLDQYVPKPHKP